MECTEFCVRSREFIYAVLLMTRVFVQKLGELELTIIPLAPLPNTTLLTTKVVPVVDCALKSSVIPLPSVWQGHK